MTTAEWHDVMVCTDCYTAHHYGAFRVAVFADGTSILWDDETNVPEGATLQWFAGDSDNPCEAGEPLSEIGDAVHVTDNTCSDHDGSEGWTDDENACTHCGQPGYETGITEFSWSRCQGCGSTLGGSRYRLAIWQ